MNHENIYRLTLPKTHGNTRNRTLIIALMACTATAAMAQADSTRIDTTDIAKTAELGEVVVNRMRVTNKVDRQLLIPTKSMVKAAADGYGEPRT